MKKYLEFEFCPLLFKANPEGVLYPYLLRFSMLFGKNFKRNSRDIVKFLLTDGTDQASNRFFLEKIRRFFPKINRLHLIYVLSFFHVKSLFKHLCWMENLQAGHGKLGALL